MAVKGPGGGGGQDQRLLMFSAMAGGRTVQNSRLPVLSDVPAREDSRNWDLSKLFDKLTVECR